VSKYQIQTEDAELKQHVQPSLTEGVVQTNQTSLAMVKAKIESASGVKVALSVDEASHKITVRRQLHG
jgi:hypothetical protein